MLVMALFGGIRSNCRLFLLLGILITLTLSGCGVTDKLRPEVNNQDLLRTDAGTMVVDFPDAKANLGNVGTIGGILGDSSTDSSPSGGSSSSGGDSSSSSNGSSTGIGSSNFTNATAENGYIDGGKMIVDPSNFSELPHTLVSANDYATYLTQEVYEPISELISNLPVEDRKSLYFRVFHVGYNQNQNNGRLEAARPLDLTESYGTTNVAGAALSMFALEWLQQLPYNQDAVENSRGIALKQATNAVATLEPPDGYNDLLDVDWLAASGIKGFPPSILAMWGNPRTESKTFRGFMQILSIQTVGVVPDIKLKIYTKSTSSSNLTLNRYRNTNTTRYLDSVTKQDLKLIFGSYNQFAGRTCKQIDKMYADDSSSLLYAYLDGYTKTLVFLGTEPGGDLQSCLGDSYSEAFSKISGIKSPTEWQDIQQILPDLTTLSEGSKGVD